MSTQNGDWGDMVLPGVYMIQRTVNPERTQRVVNADGQVNLELLHLELEELTSDIDRLKKSNEEILYYLSHKEEYKDDNSDAEEDCSMAAMLATSANTVEEEDDDEIFHDALQENEGVIKRKEAELAVLQTLIAGQKCGCHAHTHENPTSVDHERTSENTAPAGEVLQPEVNTIPANRIVL